MSDQTPVERLARALEAAAERQLAATPRRRPRRRWLALAGVAATFGVGAAAWAATALLSPGSPVPFVFGAPVAGEAEGAPLPDTVRLLISDVADPAGGPPWALRYWETDRTFACVQVGRLYEGKLGQITGGKVFHELRVGVTAGALGYCFGVDGSGHAFAAVQADAQRGAQPPPCPTPQGTMRVRGRVIRCSAATRTLDFGLLGPNASALTYRSGGRVLTAKPEGGVGAYLIVQHRLPVRTREVGFHHQDPKLNVRVMVPRFSFTSTPASNVIRSVTYTAGTCTVRPTSSTLGACDPQAGYVPIPQPAIGDVRAPVRVTLLPDGRTFRVRFRAPQAVVDGRSAYNIQIVRKGGRNPSGRGYDHNVAAGALVSTTFRARPGWRGTYVVTVTFRTAGEHPGPAASPQWPGLLVGRAEVTFR